MLSTDGAFFFLNKKNTNGFVFKWTFPCGLFCINKTNSNLRNRDQWHYRLPVNVFPNIAHTQSKITSVVSNSRNPMQNTVKHITNYEWHHWQIFLINWSITKFILIVPCASFLMNKTEPSSMALPRRNAEPTRPSADSTQVGFRRREELWEAEVKHNENN